MIRFPLLVASFCVGQAALAEAPRVVADIPPVHALVSQVLGDLGEADLMIPAGASPHGYSMRPSEAVALSKADLVVMIGPELTPWITKPLATLAQGAEILHLLKTDETLVLQFRDGVVFGQEGHAGEDDHDEHGDHDDHDEAAHDDHSEDDHADDHAGDDDHADHAEETAGHHDHDAEGHDHDGVDPHAWLDPENAKIWLGAIAARLAELDPENAQTYHSNADEGRVLIDMAMQEVNAILDDVRGSPFVVFHDAYHYFEQRFDIRSSGAIRLSDSADPSPARVAEIRTLLQGLGPVCVLSEPQFNPDLVAAVTRGQGSTGAVIDPLGTAFRPGADLYPNLLTGMARALAECR